MKKELITVSTNSNSISNFSIENLMSKAIENNLSPETMEKFLKMRQELKAEWAKEQFDKSMALFQSECPTIEKKRQGYNYKYADLTAIIEQTKELLSGNGFSYTFDTEENEGAIVVSCLVKHTAGHSEKSKATIHKESTSKMNASQQSGAAMTYGKRYAFCNAFGILTGDEDTDAASEKTETKPVAKQSFKDFNKPVEIPVEQKSEPTSEENKFSIIMRKCNGIKDLLTAKQYKEKLESNETLSSSQKFIIKGILDAKIKQLS